MLIWQKISIMLWFSDYIIASQQKPTNYYWLWAWGFFSNHCHVNEIPDNKISCFKTKLRSIYKRFNIKRISYKYQKIFGNLSRNKNFIILKQENSGEVAVIDRRKCPGKCLNFLHVGTFFQLDHDTAKTIEEEIQRSICKINLPIAQTRIC